MTLDCYLTEQILFTGKDAAPVAYHIVHEPFPMEGVPAGTDLNSPIVAVDSEVPNSRQLASELARENASGVPAAIAGLAPKASQRAREVIGEAGIGCAGAGVAPGDSPGPAAGKAGTAVADPALPVRRSSRPEQPY